MLTDDQESSIIALYKCGYSFRRIARETGFCRNTVSRVVNGVKPQRRKVKHCNDKIWKAMKIALNFTVSDIERLSGCSGVTIRRTMSKLSEYGIIKKNGNVFEDGARREKWRLAFSYQKYETFPLINQDLNIDIITMVDTLFKKVKSGIYEKEKEVCIQICEKLIGLFGGLNEYK